MKLKLDATAKSNDNEFGMDLKKAEFWNFEGATRSGNTRKVTIFGLLRAAQRPVGSFGSRVKLFFFAVLLFLGATPAFAVPADHSSSIAVTTSLVKSTKTNDYECFIDALSPQSRIYVTMQENPQKIFQDFAQNTQKMLKQVPEEQRPFVMALLVNQLQRLALNVNGKWYIDANQLLGNKN